MCIGPVGSSIFLLRNLHDRGANSQQTWTNYSSFWLVIPIHTPQAQLADQKGYLCSEVATHVEHTLLRCSYSKPTQATKVTLHRTCKGGSHAGYAASGTPKLQSCIWCESVQLTELGQHVKWNYWRDPWVKHHGSHCRRGYRQITGRCRQDPAKNAQPHWFLPL